MKFLTPLFAIVLLFAFSACASQTESSAAVEKVKAEAVAAKVKEAAKPKPVAKKPVVKSVQRGKASWYSIKTNGGTVTASGKPLRENASTAAHKTLKMGTRVRVTNLANGKSEIVKITDRGPYIKGRIIDVTIGVARRLNFVKRGVVPVKVEVLGKDS